MQLRPRLPVCGDAYRWDEPFARLREEVTSVRASHERRYRSVRVYEPLGLPGLPHFLAPLQECLRARRVIDELPVVYLLIVESFLPRLFKEITKTVRSAVYRPVLVGECNANKCG